MGSRRFFYFLPLPGSSLDIRSAVRSIMDLGLSFQPTVFINTIDTHGIISTSNEQPLQDPPDVQIAGILASNDHMEVETTCYNTHIAFTTTFGSPHTPPVFSLSVSNRRWRALSQTNKEHYENVLIQIADQTKAETILIIDDPADDFTGQMELVDKHWIIDLDLPDGTTYDSIAVWATEAGASHLLVRPLLLTGRRKGKYSEFKETIPN